IVAGRWYVICQVGAAVPWPAPVSRSAVTVLGHLPSVSGLMAQMPQAGAVWPVVNVAGRDIESDANCLFHPCPPIEVRALSGKHVAVGLRRGFLVHIDVAKDARAALAATSDSSRTCDTSRKVHTTLLFHALSG